VDDGAQAGFRQSCISLPPLVGTNAGSGTGSGGNSLILVEVGETAAISARGFSFDCSSDSVLAAFDDAIGVAA
jgi:hypothetical protein